MQGCTATGLVFFCRQAPSNKKKELTGEESSYGKSECDLLQGWVSQESMCNPRAGFGWVYSCVCVCRVWRGSGGWWRDGVTHLLWFLPRGFEMEMLVSGTTRRGRSMMDGVWGREGDGVGCCLHCVLF